MTSTVEISVQKAIDPYLKLENLGRGGGKCYDGDSKTQTLAIGKMILAISIRL